MTSPRILAPGALCLMLAACGGGPTALDALTNPAPCPIASVLGDASRIVEMNGAQELQNVGFTGEITGIRSLCEYADGKPIIADLEIDFALGRGPAAQGTSRTYSYFVAVTRRDTAIITKQSFNIDANFGRDTIIYLSDDVDRITIPRADNSVAGSNFEIIVGFDVTPEQLEFNRSGVRFRPDAGNADAGNFEAPRQ